MADKSKSGAKPGLQMNIKKRKIITIEESRSINVNTVRVNVV